MKHACVAAAAAVLSLVGHDAWAQPALESKDYRRLDRQTHASPQFFAFELRLGTYAPRVDEEFGGRATPYAQVFGADRKFFMGLEFDWQALRIPYLGTLGPGVSWGYTSTSSKAKISGTQVDSAETTSFSVMPMSLTGVLRIDAPARGLGVPLVPYGKAGLGLGLWSASNESGVSERDGVYGRGRSWGSHLALGGMFLLDVIDPSSALTFDEEMGVNNSYVYFEWVWSDLGGKYVETSKPQMQVGTSSWVTGVAFEF